MDKTVLGRTTNHIFHVGKDSSQLVKLTDVHDVPTSKIGFLAKLGLSSLPLPDFRSYNDNRWIQIVTNQIHFMPLNGYDSFGNCRTKLRLYSIEGRQESLESRSDR